MAWSKPVAAPPANQNLSFYDPVTGFVNLVDLVGGGGGGTPGGSVEGAVQTRNAAGDGFDGWDNATFDGSTLVIDTESFVAMQFSRSRPGGSGINVTNGSGTSINFGVTQYGLFFADNGSTKTYFCAGEQTNVGGAVPELRVAADARIGFSPEVAFPDNTPVDAYFSRVAANHISLGATVSNTPTEQTLSATNAAPGSSRAGADLTLKGGDGDGGQPAGNVSVGGVITVTPSIQAVVWDGAGAIRANGSAIDITDTLASQTYMRIDGGNNGEVSVRRGKFEVIAAADWSTISANGFGTNKLGQIDIDNAGRQTRLRGYGSARSETRFGLPLANNGELTQTAGDLFVGANSGNVRIGAELGNIILHGLPIADPLTAGALWNDAGTVKVSAG